jgi:4-carboxymuconolactone decarboxylase
MQRDLTDFEILTLVRISACVALRNEEALRHEFQYAIEQGFDLKVIREAVLQTYLFAGYASTINAFIVLNELTNNKDPYNADIFFQEESKNLEMWESRGKELCRRIYGPQYEKLMDNMRSLHPDLADWILWEGYGKVLSRPFLTPAVRELLIVSMTAALGVERQFHAHVRGALNVGANPDQLTAVLNELKLLLPETFLRPYHVILTGILKSSDRRG